MVWTNFDLSFQHECHSRTAVRCWGQLPQRQAVYWVLSLLFLTVTKAPVSHENQKYANLKKANPKGLLSESDLRTKWASSEARSWTLRISNSWLNIRDPQKTVHYPDTDIEIWSQGNISAYLVTVIRRDLKLIYQMVCLFVVEIVIKMMIMMVRTIYSK